MFKLSVKNPRRARGLTLLEISMVLVVVGIILASSYVFYDPSTLGDKIKVKGAIKYIEVIKQALANFEHQTNCYPIKNSSSSSVPPMSGYNFKATHLYKYDNCNNDESCNLICRYNNSKLKAGWRGPYLRGITSVPNRNINFSDHLDFSEHTKSPSGAQLAAAVDKEKPKIVNLYLRIFDSATPTGESGKNRNREF